MIERDLMHKRQARETELNWRKAELGLSRERWEEDKRDIQYSREQSKKQLGTLIALYADKK